jgi:TonB-linked SusC/RagA family outer membrane protein
MKRILLLCLTAVFMLASGAAWAQERTVTGRVTSTEDSSPIPGVNVVVKGTTTGTVTDSNGNFSLAAPTDGTLVFTFIGLTTQEVAIGGRTSIDVQLTQDVQQLTEVIVTAGGLESRTREIGSAQTQVATTSLVQARPVNVASGLQGKVAGFQINATSSGVNPEYRLILRGQRSMTGNNQALIVLDNVIVPNSVLSNLNANDIESMNILQGAGASALYGSQASNGALIITTKKGKSGRPEINVSHTLQFTQVAFFPKIQERFGAGGSAYGTNQAGSPVFSYLENQSYGPQFDGSIRPLGPPLEDGTQLYTTYKFKPGHDDFWEIGRTNQTDFSLSTGDDKGSFFISGQYVKVTGTTPGDEYTRGNIRVNGSRQLLDKLKVTFATSVSPNKYDVTSATDEIYDNMLNMPSNVDITQFKDWRNNKFANPNGFYNPWYLNPYFSADNERYIEKNTYLTGNLELKFSPIEGLDIIGREGVSSRFYTQQATTMGFDYTDYAKNTDASSKTDIPGAVSEWANQSHQLVSDLIAQYVKTFNDFNINVVAGTQLIENMTRIQGTGIGGLVVDNLYNLSNGTGNPQYGAGDFHTRLVGVYGQATIGFKDVVFLTARGRNDADSRLNKENRSFFYPSADAAIVVSEAIPAIGESGIVNFLKIRGSVAKVGQVNLGGLIGGVPGSFYDWGAYYTRPVFESNTSYQTGNGFPYGSLAGYSVGNGMVSTDLKPEFTHSVEFGLDMNLFNDRITTKTTFYSNRTDNQTINTYVSNATGYQRLLTNVGETSGKGVEVALNGALIRNENLEVNLGLNYTHQTVKVNSISDALPSLVLSTLNTATSNAVAGQPFPVIMGLDYERDDQGHVIVDRTTGLPSTTSSNVILGNATPKNIIGFNGSVDFKGIRFAFQFEYRGDYYVYNDIGPSMDWSGTSFRTAQYNRLGFVFPNSVYMNDDGAYVPNTDVAISSGNGNSGFWSDGINRNTTSNYVTRGDFLKLRELSISYDLPQSILEPVSKVIKGVNFSLQGRNLFLWMTKDNLYTDPEYSNAGATGNGTGLNGLAQTPPVRYYGGTLSLKL